MKLERVYRTIDPAVEYERDYYINHSHASAYNNDERIRGAHLTTPENADNFSLNVAYFYVDDVLAYDQNHAYQSHEHPYANRLYDVVAGTDQQQHPSVR